MTRVMISTQCFWTQRFSLTEFLRLFFVHKHLLLSQAFRVGVRVSAKRCNVLLQQRQKYDINYEIYMYMYLAGYTINHYNARNGASTCKAAILDSCCSCTSFKFFRSSSFVDVSSLMMSVFASRSPLTSRS